MDHRITVDYSTHKGLIRKELYGSGLHIFVSDRNISDFSDVFKTLRFPAVRNHDWSLNNPNQRLIDIHHIFPLLHLDPSDERNYYFAPSDEVIRLVYEADSKVFYRLGTSIEHPFQHLPSDRFPQIRGSLRRRHTALHARLEQRVSLRHEILGNLE